MPDSQKTPSLPTPVQADLLNNYLEGYSDEQRSYLFDGFTNGFRLHFTGLRTSQDSHNLKSAIDNPIVVKAKLASELQAGRIAGPFQTLPHPDLKISPLGVVPKRQEGQFRLIHHLSYPRASGLSVNDGIPKEYTAVSYAGIENAVALIKKLGHGCFMAKTDIKSAFRILPVHCLDHTLLGFSWEGQYYYDRCVPMGCASSCAIFESFSSALEWIATQKLGCHGVVHILDDFLFIEKTQALCERALRKFLEFCSEVGIPIASEKTFQPNKVMDFVGITLDSDQMEARLPLDKIAKCHSLIDEFLNRKSCKKREMESLIGYLNFTCSVVLPGRAFLRRLISSIIGVKEPYHFVKIFAEMKSDLEMWKTFVESFNGKSMFLQDRFLTSDVLSLYTDTAASFGYGAIYSSYWFYGAFPPQCRNYNITLLELYPIVLAINVWGHLWKNHCVRFYTDNLALVYILNQKTSKDKKIMKLVRCLVLACMNHNVMFQASHISGCKNVLADSLSRLQVKEFQRLSPSSKRYPTLIPDSLLPANFFQV